MSDFDQFDHELSAALQSRSDEPTGSVADAHSAVLARAGKIRRRRAGVAGGGLMAVLLIGGFGLIPRGQDSVRTVSDTGSIAPTIIETPNTNAAVVAPEDSVATTTTGSPSPNSATVPPPVTTAIDRSIPGSTAGGVATETTQAPTDTIDPSQTSVPQTSVNTTVTTSLPEQTPTTVTPPPSSASTSEPSLPPPAPFTKTYNSSGGSITVNWNGSALSLVSISPATGFESEIEDNTAVRVRVRFRSDSSDSRIEVRFKNNQVTETIS